MKKKKRDERSRIIVFPSYRFSPKTKTENFNENPTGVIFLGFT